MRVHSGALPYPCHFPGCTKRFRWKSSLKPHVKVHLASAYTITSSPTTATSFNPVVSVQALQRAESSLPVSVANAECTTLLPKTVSAGGIFYVPPKVCMRRFTNANDTFPAAMKDSSFCTMTHTPNEELKDWDQVYSCSFVGCGQNFTRLSHLLDHESAEKHSRGQVPVNQILPHNSQDQEYLMEKKEIDLSCNSVLSGSQSSFDADVGPFTLDSLQYSLPVRRTAVDEDLWKNELSIMDGHFLDLSATPTAESNDDESPSSYNSNVSISNEKHLRPPDYRWMRQPLGCSSSNGEFSSNTYIS